MHKDSLILSVNSDAHHVLMSDFMSRPSRRKRILTWVAGLALIAAFTACDGGASTRVDTVATATPVAPAVTAPTTQSGTQSGTPLATPTASPTSRPEPTAEQRTGRSGFPNEAIGVTERVTITITGP